MAIIALGLAIVVTGCLIAIGVMAYIGTRPSHLSTPNDQPEAAPSGISGAITIERIKAGAITIERIPAGAITYSKITGTSQGES